MSIVSKTAKFVIKAALSGLAREAAAAELKAKKVIAKRDAKIAKLDKDIIAHSKREDVEIAKIREKAQIEIANIKRVKNRKIVEKQGLRWNCGAECRQLNIKAEAARELKRKLEAVVA